MPGSDRQRVVHHRRNQPLGYRQGVWPVVLGVVRDGLRSSLGGDAYRYEEWIVTAGDDVTLTGSVTDAGEIAGEYIITPATGNPVSVYARKAAGWASGGVILFVIGLYASVQHSRFSTACRGTRQLHRVPHHHLTPGFAALGLSSL